jgi:hypothetical protein
MTRRVHFVVAFTMAAVIAFQPVLLPIVNSTARADEPLVGDPDGGTPPLSPPDSSENNLDGDTLTIIEQTNVEITYTGGSYGVPLSVSAEPIDPSLPSSYTYFANSVDGLSSVLFIGGASSGEIDARWMTATSVSLDDAVALQAMMVARGGVSSNISSSDTFLSILYEDFWDNYTHYLTNPS